MSHRTGIIFAYDSSFFDDRSIALLEAIMPYVDIVKVGLQAMTAEDSQGATVAFNVRRHVWETYHKKVMWDGKYLDIKNTVIWALKNIVGFASIATVTLHATNSDDCLREATEVCADRILPLAVTVLTDLDDRQCMSRFGATPNNTVLRFATNAKKLGIHGLVCAPKELAFLRAEGALEGVTTVIPGTRSDGVTSNDQNKERSMTPGEAAKLGADYVVIGREVSNARDPAVAIKRIREDLDAANATT
jgi:orotidine-5'-phosphate decarboxylase